MTQLTITYFIKILEPISSTNQLIPWYNPLPETAELGKIAQCLDLMESKSKNYFISSNDIDP